MAIFLKSFNYESVQVLDDGKKAVIAQLVDTNAPSTFPADGTDVDGKFPTDDPANTSFLPGSSFHATSSTQVFVMNTSGGWDEQ